MIFFLLIVFVIFFLVILLVVLSFGEFVLVFSSGCLMLFVSC